MELLISNENHSLTLRAYVASFSKSSHKYASDKGLTVHMKHVNANSLKLNFLITCKNSANFLPTIIGSLADTQTFVTHIMYVH